MKKRVKNLSLTKRKISSLNQFELHGGLAASATPTIFLTISQLICPADDNKMPAKPKATSGCP